MSIKIVRLNSGEEILCDMVVEDGKYTLKKPLIIIPAQGGQIGFMSWMPYADTDDGVTISEDFVAFTIEPMKELISEYKSQTSDVIIPDSTLSTVGPSLKLTE